MTWAMEIDHPQQVLQRATTMPEEPFFEENET